MTERANLVKERDADRLCVLLAIYDLTGGRPHVRLFLKDVFPTTGIPEERADAAARHLNQARLVTLGPSRTVQILQAGIDAAERVSRAESQKNEGNDTMPKLTGNRLKFLRALVQCAEWRTDTGAPIAEVGAECGFSPDEVSQLDDWLTSHHFIEGLTATNVSVTALAIDTLEELGLGPETEGKNIVATNPKKVFIIHGRNDKAFAAMRDFLRSLGLEASDFNQMVADRGGSPFVGKVINEAMREMQAMVAVFTPDEYASLRETHRRGHDRPEDVERWQARPNVLLEAGMALAIDEDRTIFVILGKVSVPSDIEGRHLFEMSNDAPSRNVLEPRLEGVGCDVKAQSDWLHSGDFDGGRRRALVRPARRIAIEARSEVRGWGDRPGDVGRGRPHEAGCVAHAPTRDDGRAWGDADRVHRHRPGGWSPLRRRGTASHEGVRRQVDRARARRRTCSPRTPAGTRARCAGREPLADSRVSVDREERRRAPSS